MSWSKVTLGDPCPVCGKPDYCGRTDDGAVRCMRVQDAPDGWRVVKSTDTEGGTVFRRADDSQPRREKRPAESKPLRDWGEDARTCAEAITDEQVRQLAEELGVTPESLRAIGVGWDRVRGCPTFPERDASGKVVGVARRHEGRKRMPRGHRRGLVVPEGLESMPDPVLVCEGPTDVAALLTMGLAGVGRPNNVGGAEQLAALLEGRDVVVLGENDQKADGPWPGLKGAHAVAGKLASTWGAPVSWAMTPDRAKDVREWLAGRARADSGQAAGREFRGKVEAGAMTAQPSVQGAGRSAGSQAGAIAKLAEQAELFHTPDGEPHATIPNGGHCETWPLRSRGFRRWLSHAYYRMHGSAPRAQALSEALAVLEGRACYSGPEHEVFVRLGAIGDAGDGGFTIFLDLADPAWRAVRIDTGGWAIVDRPPIRFRRPRGMHRLPDPVPGGSIDELRRFVNVEAEGDFALMVSWLLAAYWPVGPYPILALHGEQGSAKSTAARLLRSLIDPNAAPLRSSPREVRDLMIAAQNGWALVFDNLSRIPDWMSDALCRMSTGGGFGTRELYSDAEEVILEATRPLMITGITELGVREDLLDRTIQVILPTIPADRRMTEGDLWSAFEPARPRLLGAFLDALSVSSRDAGTTRLEDLPRMADFAVRAVAAEPAMPWPRGTFLRAYADVRSASHELAVETSSTGQALLAWMENRDRWAGTSTELLAELEGHVDEKVTRRRDWPKRPRDLSAALRRLAPPLRAMGLEVEFPRSGRKRRICIEKVAHSSVISVTSVTKPAGAPAKGVTGDAGVTLG